MSGESRRSVAVELLIWIFDAEKKESGELYGANALSGRIVQYICWSFKSAQFTFVMIHPSVVNTLISILSLYFCAIVIRCTFRIYNHPVNSKFSTWHYANFGARLYLMFWCGRTELKKLKMKWLTNLRSCFPSLTLCLLCPQINNSVAFCYR